jgi:hypothetical protein
MASGLASKHKKSTKQNLKFGSRACVSVPPCFPSSSDDALGLESGHRGSVKGLVYFCVLPLHLFRREHFKPRGCFKQGARGKRRRGSTEAGFSVVFLSLYGMCASKATKGCTGWVTEGVCDIHALALVLAYVVQLCGVLYLLPIHRSTYINHARAVFGFHAFCVCSTWYHTGTQVHVRDF